MADKPVPHVYASIASIETLKPGHRRITLEGDIWFELGGDAETFYRDLKCGDLVLIDLLDWETRGYAHVFAYRPRTDLCGRNDISRVQIGNLTPTSFGVE